MLTAQIDRSTCKHNGDHGHDCFQHVVGGVAYEVGLVIYVSEKRSHKDIVSIYFDALAKPVLWARIMSFNLTDFPDLRHPIRVIYILMPSHQIVYVHERG